ncbi:MAG: hypothetical protein KGH59_01375 [Candidatus Micrarchaeota archaeon]|nr:hypothetical protein [Candidatus Micrarchaeota archaeon]MDE1804417.1 hypothetical protein [Candidatus Micrarchaeota archaeon]
MAAISNKSKAATSQLDQLAKKKVGVTVKEDAKGWPESFNFSRIKGNDLISITIRREYQDKTLGVAEENPLKYCSRIVPNALIEIVRPAGTGCMESMKRVVLLPDGELDNVKGMIAESRGNPKEQIGKVLMVLLPKLEEILGRKGQNQPNEKQLREILSVAKRNCEEIVAFIN